MALAIVNWNIDENITWYVRLADAGSAVLAELYLTQAAAEARTDLQAGGESTGYGSAVEITLTADPAATQAVTLFQSAYAWHLTVSGQSGDAAKIFKVKPFVDMDEIAHPIYRVTALVEARATAEINAHTHAAIIRDVALGIHLPSLEAGQIAALESDRIGSSDLSQIHEHRIIGTPNSLVSELEIRKYLGLKR